MSAFGSSQWVRFFCLGEFWLLIAGGPAYAEAPAALGGASAPRVAMLDFTTEDNSYSSMHAAVDFTAALQTQLSGEPGVEWVERTRLQIPRQELELGGFNQSPATAVRSGKWLKADLLVLGRFQPDEKEGWTLALEILDLDRAEVLAEREVKFAGSAGRPLRPLVAQSGAAAEALREALPEAKSKRLRFAGQIAVAPLFFYPVSQSLRSSVSPELKLLSENYFQRLEKAVATNSRQRIVRFPRGVRSLEESELAVNGLVEAETNAWLKAADIYVWGTYFQTNSGRGGAGSSIEATLNPTEDFDGLYFVSRGDGRHMFAKSYPEHLRNIVLARAMIAARAESAAVDTSVVGRPVTAAP